MSTIFISYSSNDKDFVRELADDLKDLGHKPWLDEWEIKVGECIVTKIEEGISKSDFVVVVLSPDSVNSGWVEKEWKSAYWSEIENRELVVLPVLIRDCEIPALLKTKKYADFRKKYSIGFSQLTQSITPAVFEEGSSALVKETRDDKELSELIRKIQVKEVRLSQCIAETLPIAQKYGDEDLVEFCRNELTGWNIEKKFDEKVSYRLIQVFCSVMKINPQYLGWGERASNMFDYMEAHPDEFFPRKIFMAIPISSLERKQPVETEKAFICFTLPVSSFTAKSNTPDAKVYCYASSTTYDNVVEAIRTELTKRLLNLLPQIES